MKSFLFGGILLAFCSSSFAALPSSSSTTGAPLIPTQINEAPANPEEKICLVVRKSIYGKYRKKCKTTQQWMDFIAVYAPKIKRQLSYVGSTRGMHTGPKFGYMAHGPIKEK